MTRRPVINRGELMVALMQGFPVEMFDDVKLDLNLDYGPMAYKHVHKLVMRMPSCVGGEHDLKDLTDTEIYIPTSLRVNSDGHPANPLLGFYSDWLCNDLGADDPAEELMFLFGRCTVDQPPMKGGKTHRIAFYVIDGPERSSLASTMLTLRRKKYEGGSVEEYWTEETYGHDRDGVRYFRRCSKVFDNEWYLEMKIYPMGFRYAIPDSDGKFVWEDPNNNVKYCYNSFESFKDARVGTVRSYFRGLLQKRDDTGEVCDIQVKSEGVEARSEVGDLMAMSISDLCRCLNERLAVLRERGLINLGTFESVDYGQRLGLSRGSSTHYYSRAEAVQHVAHLEQKLRLYETYRGEFEKFRGRIEAIEGTLSTDDTGFAEFEVPRLGGFGPKESPTVVERFAYWKPNVTLADEWLKGKEAEYAGAYMKKTVSATR